MLILKQHPTGGSKCFKNKDCSLMGLPYRDVFCTRVCGSVYVFIYAYNSCIMKGICPERPLSKSTRPQFWVYDKGFQWLTSMAVTRLWCSWGLWAGAGHLLWLSTSHQMARLMAGSPGRMVLVWWVHGGTHCWPLKETSSFYGLLGQN